MFFGAFTTNYYLINTIISPLLISLSNLIPYYYFISFTATYRALKLAINSIYNLYRYYKEVLLLLL